MFKFLEKLKAYTANEEPIIDKKSTEIRLTDEALETCEHWEKWFRDTLQDLAVAEACKSDTNLITKHEVQLAIYHLAEEFKKKSMLGSENFIIVFNCCTKTYILAHKDETDKYDDKEKYEILNEIKFDSISSMALKKMVDIN